MINVKNSLNDQTDHETVEAIGDTYRAMDRKITALLSKNDLTRPQFMALRVVHDDGPIPMNRISDYLSVTPGNVTGIIDRLVRSGLIERKGRPGDRRKIIIELTKKGEETYKKVLASYLDFLEKVLNQLSYKEREELKNHLVKLEEAIVKVDI